MLLLQPSFGCENRRIRLATEWSRDGVVRASITLLHQGLPGTLVSVTAIGHSPPFDGCPFLVVVPCLNQHERNRRRTIVVAVVEIERVVEGLSTPALHVAVESPLFPGDLEAPPSPPHHPFSPATLLSLPPQIPHIPPAPLPSPP